MRLRRRRPFVAKLVILRRSETEYGCLQVTRSEHVTFQRVEGENFVDITLKTCFYRPFTLVIFFLSLAYYAKVELDDVSPVYWVLRSSALKVVSQRTLTSIQAPSSTHFKPPNLSLSPISTRRLSVRHHVLIRILYCFLASCAADRHSRSAYNGREY